MNVDGTSDRIVRVTAHHAERLRRTRRPRWWRRERFAICAIPNHQTMRSSDTPGDARSLQKRTAQPLLARLGAADQLERQPADRIDLAPSAALRKRFHGKPDAYDAFRSAYFEELKSEAAQSAVKNLLDHLREGPVTLLYAARDERRNNAVALKEWLERQRKRRT